MNHLTTQLADRIADVRSNALKLRAVADQLDSRIESFRIDPMLTEPQRDELIRRARTEAEASTVALRDQVSAAIAASRDLAGRLLDTRKVDSRAEAQVRALIAAGASLENVIARAREHGDVEVLWAVRHAAAWQWAGREWADAGPLVGAVEAALVDVDPNNAYGEAIRSARELSTIEESTGHAVDVAMSKAAGDDLGAARARQAQGYAEADGGAA